MQSMVTKQAALSSRRFLTASGSMYQGAGPARRDKIAVSSVRNTPSCWIFACSPAQKTSSTDFEKDRQGVLSLVKEVTFGKWAEDDVQEVLHQPIQDGMSHWHDEERAEVHIWQLH